MPEHEFELYLSLLSRFLKLSPGQREEIAEELRGHLEMRLEDLAKEGHSREEAIRLALDEMGDAGELAQHFSTITRSRRRKLIMRCTLGTAIALAFGLVLFTAFWNEPDRPHQVLQSLAQEGAASGTSPALAEREPSAPSTVGESLSPETKIFKSDELEEWDKRLGQVMEFDMQGLTLQEAMNQISEQGEFMIVAHDSALETVGDLDSLEVPRNYARLQLRQILNLLLEPNHLTYALRDGVLFILAEHEAQENPEFMQLRMYDCRDYLLASVPETDDLDEFSVMSKRVRHLMDLIVQYQGDWEAHGSGEGTIQSMDGVLVIRQTAKVHASVEKFLNELRKPYVEQSSDSRFKSVVFGDDRLYTP